MAQIKCESFEEFVKSFDKVFHKKGKQIVLAPVRAGKTYAAEKYISELLRTKKKNIVIFITEKNVLAESSYANILKNLKDRPNLIKNNIFLFDHEKSSASTKNLKNFFVKNSDESVCVMSAFCYFTGEQQSPLFKQIVTAKQQQNFTVTFIIDEGESLFNSFQKEIIIQRPQDKIFKTPSKGNGLIAIDELKSELVMNHNVKPLNRKENIIEGQISAVPGNPQNFEYLTFSSYNINTNDLYLHIETYEPTFSNSVVFYKVQTLNISSKLFSTKKNTGGIRRICYFENNVIFFDELIFQTIELLLGGHISTRSDLKSYYFAEMP
jgi:hypothetical protein